MDTLAAGLVTVVILIVVGTVIAFAVGLPAPVKAPRKSEFGGPVTGGRRPAGSVRYYPWALGSLVVLLLIYLLAQPMWVIFVVHRERPAGDFQGRQVYTRTCEACHGDKGFGIRLTPYLARDELATRLGLDPTDPQDLETLRRYVDLMVSEGHGMMPAWSEQKGGPLSAVQIQALVDLIIEDRIYTDDR